MPTIPIEVRNKIATAADGSSIVCGNSDYVISFTFDSEWDDYPLKTMHVTWIQNGKRMYYDLEFEGSVCAFSTIYNAISVFIGVYAGDIHTSTSAHILCRPCITDHITPHQDPPPDVYTQLLEYLSGMGGDRVSVYDSLYGSQVTDSAITGIAGMHPKFTCDTGYYFDYKVSCTLSYRQYTKKDTLPAIGIIIYTIGYSTPFFISPFESAVAYEVSGYSDAQAVYSVNYDGLLWYYSRIPYAMPGEWNDSEGHLLTYSGTVNFDSSNDRVTPESVLEILQAVHAQSEED